MKNIVIDFYDPINIIQMLGRKRITSPDEKINLFVKEPSKAEITCALHQKNKPKTYTQQKYNEFLLDYYKQISESNFIQYWTSIFMIPLNDICFSKDLDNLSKTLMRYIGKQIPKEKIDELFSPFIEKPAKARIGTLNNFLKQNTLPFEIESKRVRVNGKQIHKLFVRSAQNEITVAELSKLTGKSIQSIYKRFDQFKPYIIPGTKPTLLSKQILHDVYKID